MTSDPFTRWLAIRQNVRCVRHGCRKAKGTWLAEERLFAYCRSCARHSNRTTRFLQLDVTITRLNNALRWRCRHQPNRAKFKISYRWGRVLNEHILWPVGRIYVGGRVKNGPRPHEDYGELTTASLNCVAFGPFFRAPCNEYAAPCGIVMICRIDWRARARVFSKKNKNNKNYTWVA